MAFILGKKFSSDQCITVDRLPVSASLPGSGGMYRSTSLRGEKLVLSAKPKSDKVDISHENKKDKTTHKRSQSLTSTVLMRYSGPKVSPTKKKSPQNGSTEPTVDTVIPRHHETRPLSSKAVNKSRSQTPSLTKQVNESTVTSASTPCLVTQKKKLSTKKKRSSAASLDTVEGDAKKTPKTKLMRPVSDAPANVSSKTPKLRQVKQSPISIERKLKQLAIDDSSMEANLRRELKEKERIRRLMIRSEIIVLNRIAAFVETANFEQSQAGASNGV